MLFEVESLDRGGLEEVVFDLVAGLDRTRFNPSVVCIERGGGVAQRLAAAGVQVDVIAGGKRAYLDLIARGRIHLVNSHYSRFGARLARWASVPHVHVLHNHYAWITRRQTLRWAAELAEVERFVAVSSAVASYAIERLGLPASRVSVIPNGVDVVRVLEAGGAQGRAPFRRQFAIPDSAYVFLLVGTFEPRKGHRALLRAFAQVAADEPSAVLVCAGNVADARFFAECREFVESRGMQQRVRFVEFFKPVGALYCGADAFVLPSVYEGFSLSSIEAAAHGLPFILTDVGGARELTRDTQAGLIVPGYLPDLAWASAAEIGSALRETPPAVVEGLAAAMREFLGHQSRWQEKGRAGAAIACSDYRVDKVVLRYEEIFEELVGVDDAARRANGSSFESKRQCLG